MSASFAWLASPSEKETVPLISITGTQIAEIDHVGESPVFETFEFAFRQDHHCGNRADALFRLGVGKNQHDVFVGFHAIGAFDQRGGGIGHDLRQNRCFDEFAIRAAIIAKGHRLRLAVIHGRLNVSDPFFRGIRGHNAQTNDACCNDKIAVPRHFEEEEEE